MMLLTEKELERRRQQRFKDEVREQEIRRYWNPQRDLELAKVWVAYVWEPAEEFGTGQWNLAGFRRRRRLRKRQTMNGFFAKIRRKLEIDKKRFVLVRDLDEASRRVKEDDQSWVLTPPQYYQRKLAARARAPTKVKPPKRAPRRAPVKAYLFNKKKTKYVALGRSDWLRSQKYLYLGPLTSTTKRQAQFEAKRTFPVYIDLLVIAADELSKPLRAAMARSKRVRAGVTRIAWPEVPPVFETMWKKFATRISTKELNGVALDDPRMVDVELALHSEWNAQGCPWLTLSWFRKQIKPWRPQCDVPKRKPKRKARRKDSGQVSRSKSKPSLKRKRTWRGKLFLKKRASRSAASTRRVVSTSLRLLGGKRSKRVIHTVLSRKDVRTVRTTARRWRR
jgi:hypothetical protein